MTIELKNFGGVLGVDGQGVTREEVREAVTAWLDRPELGLDAWDVEGMVSRLRIDRACWHDELGFAASLEVPDSRGIVIVEDFGSRAVAEHLAAAWMASPRRGPIPA